MEGTFCRQYHANPVGPLYFYGCWHDDEGSKRMKLLTEALKKKIPALYSTTTELPSNEHGVFVCKFFDPCGSWTWYVLEGSEEENGDWRFYGLVDGFEKEWGYFMLSDLEKVKGPLGIGIERDMHFEDEEVATYA